jgi:hypothetical protein
LEEELVQATNVLAAKRMCSLIAVDTWSKEYRGAESRVRLTVRNLSVSNTLA